MRHLPFEILSEIFVTYTHSSPIDIWDKREGPRLLEMVCCRWRNVAINTPRAWSSFIIVSRPEIYTACALKTLQSFLQRSGAAPLIFTFYAGYTTADTHPLLELLIEHCRRWYDVSLEMPLSLYHSIKCIRDYITILRSISLRASYNNSSGEIFAFEAAPQLQKLALLGDWSRIRTMNFPWHQLLSYADEDGTATDPLTLFAMSDLIHLTYRPRRYERDLPVHDTPQLLANLKSLRILSAHDLCFFLDNVTTPALEDLTLDDMNLRYDVKTLTPVLESLLIRSRASIRELRIDKLGSGDTPHLLRLLSRMPDLISLSINHWSSKELSQLFHVLLGSSTLLAKLQTIVLQSDLATVQDVVNVAGWNVLPL